MLNTKICLKNYSLHKMALIVVYILSLTSASCFNVNQQVTTNEKIDDFNIKVSKPDIKIYKIINNEPYLDIKFDFDTTEYPDQLLSTRLGVFFYEKSKDSDSFPMEFARSISMGSYDSQNVFFYEGQIPNSYIIDNWSQKTHNSILKFDEIYAFKAFVNEGKHTFYSKDSKELEYSFSEEIENIIKKELSVAIKKSEVKNASDSGVKFNFSLEGHIDGELQDGSNHNFFIFIKKGSDDININTIKEAWLETSKSEEEKAVSINNGDIVIVSAAQDLKEDFSISKSKFQKGEEYNTYFLAYIKTTDGEPFLQYHSKTPISITIPKPEVEIEISKIEFTSFIYDANSTIPGRGYDWTLQLEANIIKIEGLENPQKGIIRVKNPDEEAIKQDIREGKGDKINNDTNKIVSKITKEAGASTIYEEDKAFKFLCFYIQDGEDIYLSETKEIPFPEIIKDGDIGLKAKKIYQENYEGYSLTMDNLFKDLCSNIDKNLLEISGIYNYNNIFLGTIISYITDIENQRINSDEGILIIRNKHNKEFLIVDDKGINKDLRFRDDFIKNQKAELAPIAASADGRFLIIGKKIDKDTFGNDIKPNKNVAKTQPYIKIEKKDNSGEYQIDSKGNLLFQKNIKVAKGVPAEEEELESKEGASGSLNEFIELAIDAALVETNTELKEDYEQDEIEVLENAVINRYLKPIQNPPYETVEKTFSEIFSAKINKKKGA
jgi:hypothetical protein